MPLYEYECEKCGTIGEFIKKCEDRDNQKCPECGKPMKRIEINRIGGRYRFHDKGAGETQQ